MQKARSGNPVDIEDKKAAALTAAALECARRLGLSPTECSNVLGVPQGALAAMKKAQRAVDGVSGEAERADGLVRIVKCLSAQLGDSDTAWRSWLRRENDDVGGKPVELMMKRDGVIAVAAFLESPHGRSVTKNP